MQSLNKIELKSVLLDIFSYALHHEAFLKSPSSNESFSFLCFFPVELTCVSLLRSRSFWLVILALGCVLLISISRYQTVWDGIVIEIVVYEVQWHIASFKMSYSTSLGNKDQGCDCLGEIWMQYGKSVQTGERGVNETSPLWNTIETWDSLRLCSEVNDTKKPSNIQSGMDWCDIFAKILHGLRLFLLKLLFSNTRKSQ